MDVAGNRKKGGSVFEIEASNFLPPEMILIFIELFQNIGYNAAYDILKYALRKVIILIGRKKPDDTELQFEISCNDKKFLLRGNTPLTEQQMDKLVDAAADVLLSEWNGKGKNDDT